MNNELFHYGIKGQKWGVRNGPPYPLKESKKSYKEKKLQKTMNSNISGIDVAMLNIAASRWMIKERKFHLNNNKQPIKQIKKPHSEEQDQKTVNKEGYDSGSKGHLLNCTMCTTAYDMRRKGYDVKANTTVIGRPEKEIASWYKNTTKKDFYKTKNFDVLKHKLDEQPNGSRGNIVTGVGPFDSKHSMSWEKKNGKVIIRDCQSDKTYTDINNSILRQKSRHGYKILRTDNREINWDTIRDAVVPI